MQSPAAFSGAATCLLLLGVLVGCGSDVVPAPAPVPTDTWFSVRLGDKQLGYLHERSLVTLEERHRYESECRLRILRAGTEVEIYEEIELVEDPRGRVLEFRLLQGRGDRLRRVTGVLDGDRVHLTEGDAERERDWPAGALGPLAFARLHRSMRESGRHEFSALLFRASDPGLAKRLVIGLDPEAGSGRETWIFRSEDGEVVSRRVLDEEGEPLELSVPYAGPEWLRFVRTSRKEAVEVVTPVEVFSRSFVQPDRAIPSPRTLRRAIYRLRGPDVERLAIPEGPGQRILSRSPGEITLEVAIPALSEDVALFTIGPGASPIGVPAEHRELTRAGPRVESDDPLVQALSLKAVGDASDALAAARRIEGFAFDHVKRSQREPGLGSAAEAARSRRGDCTECGLLAMALARAAGLPSRAVVGWVYLPPGRGFPRGFFSYHLWIEILVAPDEWIAVDPALGTMDATHIVLGRSGLTADGDQRNLLAPLRHPPGEFEFQIVEPR